MQSLETTTSRPRSFETETRPETFETETSKNGTKSRDSITDINPAQLKWIQPPSHILADPVGTLQR